MMNKLKLTLFLLVVFVSITVAQTKWNFDVSHTNIGFEVDHMVITSVEGEFTKFEGTVETVENGFNNASINFTIDASSINTDNGKRDNHLRSDDFFNAEKFPQLIFKSKSMKQVKGKNWKLVGDLTIRDVTKEISLDVDFRGTAKDSGGNTRAGFKISGELNRFDYNLKWNKLLETGSFVVSEEVSLEIDVQLIESK